MAFACPNPSKFYCHSQACIGHLSSRKLSVIDVTKLKIRLAADSATSCVKLPTPAYGTPEKSPNRGTSLAPCHAASHLVHAEISAGAFGYSEPPLLPSISAVASNLTNTRIRAVGYYSLFRQHSRSLRRKLQQSR